MSDEKNYQYAQPMDESAKLNTDRYNFYGEKPPSDEASAAAAAQAEERERQEKSRRHGPYKFDTARLTRNRGLNIRWNHFAGKIEIYQGSCDPSHY